MFTISRNNVVFFKRLFIISRRVAWRKFFILFIATITGKTVAFIPAILQAKAGTLQVLQPAPVIALQKMVPAELFKYV
jgi:hypothetical protein